jgi:PKD repeat protein
MRFLRVLAFVVGACLTGCESTDPSNDPPIADFTVACNGLRCTVTDGSTDPDGSIEVYQWDFGDSSTIVTSRHATHAYTEPGEFTVALRVTDDGGATGSATRPVVVEVDNISPTASFTFTCAGLACDFSDGSTDIGGSIASYAWTFGDGGTGTGPNPHHVYETVGLYSVHLTVTDDRGARSTATRQVELTAAGLPPSAAFAYTCDGLTCDFADQSADVDAEGRIASHAWDFGDGRTSAEANPRHVYAELGSYLVSLQVADDLGNTGAASMTINVGGVTSGGFRADFTVGCAGLECTFSDRSSGDVIVAWEWNFGDGHTSTEQHPTHVYDVGSTTTFTVGLTVYNTDISTRVVTRQITIAPTVESGNWNSRASMPEARYGVSAAALGGILYIAGGEIRQGEGHVGRTGIFAYDPGADGWSTAGTLLHPVINAGMAALGGRIYVVGGSSEPALQIFDPATGAVQAGPPLPSPMVQATASVLQGRLHVLGVIGWNPEDLFCDGCSLSHLVFDPATSAWSQAAPPPHGTLYATGAVVDGKIHLVRWISTEGRLDVYDPATDSWSSAFGAPRGRHGSVAVAVADRLYLVGGASLGDWWTPSGRVDRYDPRTSSWHQLTSIPTTRMNHGAVAVGGFLYAIAGSPSAPEIGFSAANERLRVD